jgi:hypothetical protein
VIESRPLKLEANGSSSATFTPFAPTSKFTRGTVRLNDDRLSRDNAFHFVVSPSQRLKVLIVERPGLSQAASLYLAQALGLSQAPPFEVVQRSMEAVSGEDISGATVIILNDVPVPPGMAERLAAFVQRGGGLLAAFGPRATWPGSVANLLPAVPAATVDRTRGTPGRIGSVEYGHPVFESFRAPRSGDFSSARFYNYRQVTPEPGTAVLVRYDDGAPALVERAPDIKAGRHGRVLVWTSTLDVAWNDLALKPVFLPFIHRLGSTLASYTQRPAWRLIGDVSAIGQASGRGQTRTSQPVVVGPEGRRVTQEAASGVVELREQGFYTIGSGDREVEPIVIAANVDLAESDMARIDPQEVVAGATGLAGGAAPAGANATVTNEERERSQRVWWYLLFGGLLLLTSETLLANSIRTKYL